MMKQYCHFVKVFSHALEQSFYISTVLRELMPVAIGLSCYFGQFCFTMKTVIRLLVGLLELSFT